MRVNYRCQLRTSLHSVQSTKLDNFTWNKNRESECNKAVTEASGATATDVSQVATWAVSAHSMHLE